MLFVDSDNALGSGRRNVDDGFAIAALLLGGAPVAAIASVCGNATEEEADRNNRALGDLCGFPGPYLRSGQAGPFLARAKSPLTIAAFGPLTNIASAIGENARTEQWCRELVVVGGNSVSLGRWPPRWPYEFNLTQDVAASRRVFDSPIPWTIVPINVLNELSVTRIELAELIGPVGDYIRTHSERWLARKPRFRVGDLIAAMFLFDPSQFEIDRVFATMHANAWIDFKRGSKAVRVVRSFNGKALWNRFVRIVNAR